MSSLILGSAVKPANVVGYNRDATISAATAFASPTSGATAVLVQAETQNIRVTCDGTTPTATTGILVKTTDPGLVLTGDIAKLQVIEVAASAAVSLTYLSW